MLRRNYSLIPAVTFKLLAQEIQNHAIVSYEREIKLNFRKQILTW